MDITRLGKSGVIQDIVHVRSLFFSLCLYCERCSPAFATGLEKYQSSGGMRVQWIHAEWNLPQWISLRQEHTSITGHLGYIWQWRWMANDRSGHVWPHLFPSELSIRKSDCLRRYLQQYSQPIAEATELCQRDCSQCRSETRCGREDDCRLSGLMLCLWSVACRRSTFASFRSCSNWLNVNFFVWPVVLQKRWRLERTRVYSSWISWTPKRNRPRNWHESK